MFWILLALTIISAILLALETFVWYKTSDRVLSVTFWLLVISAILTLTIGICIAGILYDQSVIEDQIAFISNNQYAISVTGDMNAEVAFSDVNLIELQLDLLRIKHALKLFLFV